MKNPLKIGNAQAFWGDRNTAAAALVQQQQDLDILTMDYLAEVSMSILAVQKQKDPNAGYTKDFLDVVKSLAPQWQSGRKLTLITNAGGLNPEGCGVACQKLLTKLRCSPLKIAVITGDDVAHELKHSSPSDFQNIDTGKGIEAVQKDIATANVYIGSKSIVEALQQGADIIITGRVADPCLTAAPCISHFNWSWNDYNSIASATIAGHLIECGTQVTGGFSTNWQSIESMTHPGYPVIEVYGDGSMVVTKPPGTDGNVNIETVKEQLLYEIGDPDNYLSPDVTASFLSLQVEEIGKDRVKIVGAKGKPPPEKLKVSATYQDGYRIEGMITLYGRDCREKGRKCGEILLQRLKALEMEPNEYLVECLGTGDVVPGLQTYDTNETVLRIAARDHHKDSLQQLAKEIAPLVTSGPQGITGYSSGRPKVRPVYSYWPTLIDPEKVQPTVTLLEVKS
ncbi:MAG: acyclic terpene utilization AtuA family protein [Chlamydiota bacterium]